jgi:tetratricopeptide (TPR) repeat protein
MPDRRRAGHRRGPRANRLCLALLAAATLSAAAPSAAESRWTMLSGGSLTIIGDQSPATLRDIALQIEQFQIVVGGLIRNADRPLSVPTVVFVVGNRKSLEPLVPLYNGKPATVAGYFGQGQDTNYIVLCLEGFDESAAITYHEYTHLLVRNAVRSLPVWLNEGLAEYYSTYRLVDRGKAAAIGRAQKEHILLLRERYLPIAELIEVDQRSPMYNEGERRSIFYAESWALTHYLMIARPNGGAAINQYVTDVAEGRSALDAFRHAFGAAPADLDKELQSYLRRVAFSEYHFQFSEKLAVAEPGPGRALTPGEVDAWLGDAQRRVLRGKEGEPRIERAAAAEPGNATAQMILGLLRLYQGSVDQALDAFDHASALAPRDFLVQFVCGISRVRADPRGSDERRQRALETLTQATMLNGTASDAYAALAYVQMLSEKTLADARTSIERAIALAPGRLDYRLRYADIRVLQGDTEAARSVLTPIAAIKFDRSSATAASQRLDAITAHERERARILAGREPLTPDAVAPATASGSRSSDPADLVRYDDNKERRAGVVLRAVRPGEERAFGQLTRIECPSGAVRFTVEAAGRTIVTAAARMEDVELTTFLDDRNFTISCGPRPSAERVYVTWRPDDRWGSTTNGTVVAVEFLPSWFTP